MKLIQNLFALSLLIIFASSCQDDHRSGDAKVLLFSKTAGFHHDCIADGKLAIKALCADNGIQVDTTTDPTFFNEEDLEDYAAVLFFNTTGDVLESNQEIAFERYIQAGGGFVGVHAASDTEYGWNWYGNLAGAYFTSHPSIQEAKFDVMDTSFAASKFLPKEWIRTDELYNLKMVNKDVNVILTVDESTYEGGTNGDYHPMAWYHDFDGGRAFYTALGHTKESYKEELFMKHLLAGIQYSIGDNKRLDYSKSKSQYGPSQDRFAKVSLSKGAFFEPTEMTILPNDNVVVAERRGGIKMYDAKTKDLRDVGFLDVYFETGIDGVNAEEGVMGLQKDPNFGENNWLYIFYAPKGDLEVNRLSRFKFTEDKLQMDTEQVILDVASDRMICCHTGGSIAFGPGGLLYLSTGDNSTPFDEPDATYVNNGYAPLNDLPGKKQYDARRSSGNTNDLRGKILRIKVQEDGSYTIPEGNLFPVGTEKTRPEIYTMGHRNPYRISVDPKKGYVYWGDVGPDSREDAMGVRGPMGYDEMNQARGPGNFGWPLFIADNKPYHDYDYSNGKSGEAFNPAKPINDSKNNTGLRELPPAQGAFVFYPYEKSSVFSGLASGGRNAMAGPTYYADMYPISKSLPESYDGKVIIYDWMRGWMKAVSLLDDGSFGKMEPFANDVQLNNLIDMEFGPDGRLYLLEYGTGWFVQNDDSGLSYIEFNEGNRAPKIEEVTADQTSGKAPLNVSLTAKVSDPENDKLTYTWDMGNGETKTTKKPMIEYSYPEVGTYKASVTVSDGEVETSSDIISIVSGNTRPDVDIKLTSDNSSFFMSGVPVRYKVDVSDPEDGSTIDPSKLLVTVDYMEGYDEVNFSQGHQTISDAALGQNLVETSICRSCHKTNEASIGPSYTEIGEKYASEWNSMGYLKSKILNGGTGVWGENVMPANSEIDPNDVSKMIKYILSLGKEDDEDRMPPAGMITPDQNTAGKVMVVTASYTDKGADGAAPLTGTKRAVLKSSTISMTNVADVVNYTPFKFDGMDLLVSPNDGGSFAVENVDFNGVKQVFVTAGWQVAPAKGYELEMRLNSPDGKLIGKGTMPAPAKGSEGGAIFIPITEKVDTAEKVYFVYNPKEEDKLGATPLALLNVNFVGG